MKPRIRFKSKGYFKGNFECQGIIPGTSCDGWGYGLTIEEAFKNWRDEPIPF